MDDFELDLRNKGVKRWKTGAVGRKEWAYIMREAKAIFKDLLC
jgi:hypothetical protein